MAAVHGYTTTVLADEFDLTPYFNQFTATKSSQAVRTSTFKTGTDRDHTYIGGTSQGSVSLQGLWDGVAGAVDAVLDAAWGTNTIIDIGIGGYATVGNRCIMLQAKDAGHQIRGTWTDAVRVTANASADGGIRYMGRVLQPLEAETTTMNGTSVDNTTSSLFGGVGHLHVTAFSGTTGTVKIQHSTNDSLWNDLITFTAVTGVTAQRTVVTGTVDRYLRFIISADTFTSMTVYASFARNPR